MTATATPVAPTDAAGEGGLILRVARDDWAARDLLTRVASVFPTLGWPVWIVMASLALTSPLDGVPWWLTALVHQLLVVCTTLVGVSVPHAVTAVPSGLPLSRAQRRTAALVQAVPMATLGLLAAAILASPVALALALAMPVTAVVTAVALNARPDGDEPGDGLVVAALAQLALGLAGGGLALQLMAGVGIGAATRWVPAGAIDLSLPTPRWLERVLASLELRDRPVPQTVGQAVRESVRRTFHPTATWIFLVIACPGLLWLFFIPNERNTSGAFLLFLMATTLLETALLPDTGGRRRREAAGHLPVSRALLVRDLVARATAATALVLAFAPVLLRPAWTDLPALLGGAALTWSLRVSGELHDTLLQLPIHPRPAPFASWIQMLCAIVCFTLWFSEELPALQVVCVLVAVGVTVAQVLGALREVGS